ncbi:MAG: major outer membrane protein [Helicobacteraceae bacterium]|nr:major outer membrane protein [Helicobacteraceae bacterium]
MGKLKLSLAAIVALGGIANAQSLEEAIKGVGVSGYLSYEYEDNRFKNQNFIKDNNGSGEVAHTWKAEAEFKTPAQNAVSLSLGIRYDGTNNVNHGKGSPANENTAPFLGEGLGSGNDGAFGVSTFYATIAPDSTSTNINIGKMYLTTPLNDSAYDRGTGILATNSDLGYLTFIGGAFDSWSLDDLSGDLGDRSIAKPLYTAAFTFNHPFENSGVEAQAWYFYIDKVLDSAIFAELKFNYGIFALSGQYAYADVNNKGLDSILQGLGVPQNSYVTKNDFISLEASLDLESFEIPLGFRLGYITNTKDNFAVSLDGEGELQKAGKIWFDNEATEVNFSAIGGALPTRDKKDLSVIYAGISYELLESLSLELDYVNGANKLDSGGGKRDIDFYEITPSVLWKYSKNIEILTYYAMLKAERSGEILAGETNSENRNKFKVEATYYF